MSKIFISHSSSDNAKALAVAQWLEQNGWGEYFLDITPSRGLSPGERWQEALKTAADRCEAVVFLISPTWRDSKWCLAEFLLAKQLGKPVFGVLVEPTPIQTLPKEMTAEWQLCDLVSGEERQCFQVFRDQIVSRTDVSFPEVGLASLKQGLQKAGLDPSVFPWPPHNDPKRLPYRGLKALEVEDAAVFFGREAPLILALDKLRLMQESGERFFVILGASGAGKSSFLRAGLWPRLKRDDQHFLPLPVIRPERAAISGQTGLLESLENTFREYKAPKTRAALRTTLEKADGIIELVAELQMVAKSRLGSEAASPTLLISIDQAEEMFSQDGVEEAEQLLSALGKLLAHATGNHSTRQWPVPRVIVMAAIRSDAYERLQAARALAGVRQTPFNLAPMSLAEYKMVIEGPAHCATKAGQKLIVEPTLTEQLLHDAEGADALPLLAFVLERLFVEYGADGDLRLDEYRAMGGLQGAIEAAIKGAFDDPGREPAIPSDEATQRSLLHQAFPFLVTFDQESEKPKRLVATWSTISSMTWSLLERLVAARLLTKDRRRLGDGQEAVIVEVTHEALLRQWNVLADWIKAEREDLIESDRLKLDAELWAVNGKKPEWLRRGDRLRIAEVLTSRPAYQRKLELVSEFLAESRKDEELRKEEQAEHLRFAASLLIASHDRAMDSQRTRVGMSKLIASLDLPEVNKQFLRARWLEQVIWLDKKARESVWWHNRARLSTLIGGLIVPALVSLNVGSDVQGLVQVLTFVVSLMVALSAAAEEFFRTGEQWRHYRSTVEALSSEGWQFLQLSGPYANLTHSQAYPAFATRVEELSREEVETYVTQVFKEKKDGDGKVPSVS